MKSSHIIILSLFIISLFTFSCGDDDVDQHINEKTQYFEDYDSPISKWGYIDTTGKIAIEKKYDDLRPFNNGLAIANLEGQWGFIDKKGKIIIEHKYRSAFPFKEGLARIQNFDKKYGYINKKGETIVLDTFDLVFDFNSGRARAKHHETYGYIDTKGNWIIKPYFKKCSNFKNGYAKVYQFGKAGLIDTDGHFKIKFEDGFTKIYTINEDRLRLKKGKSYQFLNVKNFSQFSPTYEDATDFYNGIALVKNNSTWNFINKRYKVLNEIKADKVKYINEGNWRIKKDGHYSIIDSEGNSITTTIYDMIFEYSDGLAPYQNGDFWGYLDLEGKEIMTPILPIAWSFKNGYARVINKGKVGYIKRSSELAFPEGFTDAHDFSEGLAHVQ